MQAIPYLEEKSGRVLILNGNIPLITEQTIQKIVDKSIKEDEVATILTDNSVSNCRCEQDQ